MSKLELKHLAPYLPYGLKFLPTHYNRDKKIDTLYYLSTINNSDEFGVNGYTSNYIKPVLRPLSDLTQEIEVNGEKFIPIDYINGEFACSVPNKIEWNQSVKNKNLHFVLSEWISPQDLYGLFELLFKWHFDVFGLIDKGLAIDINTL